jgi:pilus assembly protein CpaB
VKKKKSNIIFYLISAISGLVAMVLVNVYVDRKISTSQVVDKTPQVQIMADEEDFQVKTKVVIAKRDIRIEEVITEKDIEVIEFVMPPDKFSEFMTEPEQVIGKSSVYPIFKGEWMFTKKFDQEGKKVRKFDYALAEGRRLMRVKLDSTNGLIGMLAPGDRVDVIGVFKIKHQKSYQSMSRLILQNIKVVMVGNKIPESKIENDKKKKKQAKNQKRKKQKATTVTLDVTAEEAEELTLAMNAGKIQLSLRNRFDNKIVQPGRVKIRTLAGIEKRKNSKVKNDDEGSVVVIMGNKVKKADIQ